MNYDYLPEDNDGREEYEGHEQEQTENELEWEIDYRGRVRDINSK